MKIITNLRQDHYLLSISGAVDTDHLNFFNKNLEKCLEVTTPAVLVNCDHLTNVCFAGLRSLLRYQKLFQNQNKLIVLFGLKPNLEAVFFENGLDRFITTTTSYYQALELIRRT